MAQTGIQPQVRENFDAIAAAAVGDIELTIAPETVNRDATAAAWTRTVRMRLETSGGKLHEWFSGTFATTASIADTSTAGTASIRSTTLTIVNGIANIDVSGDAESWLAAETDTLTIANITIMGTTVTGGTSVQTFV
jgi:hypothetical protein